MPIYYSECYNHQKPKPDGEAMIYALLVYISFVIVTYIFFVITDDKPSNEPAHDEPEVKKQSLETRMRDYEDEYKSYVSKYDTYIVRIDGSNFKAVSKRFPHTKDNVFDQYFVKAMANTAKDLIAKFNCQTIYVHSDEISLVFAAVASKDDPLGFKYEHIFGGRVEKIISEIPAYASVRFCHNLRKALGASTAPAYDKVTEMLDDPHIMFDARLFTVPEDYEVSNYLLWRSCHDCYRNCVSGYAQAYESQKTLNNMSTSSRIKMLKDKHNVDFDHIPQHLLYGTYIKKSEDNTFVPFSIKIRCTDDVTDFVLKKKMTVDDLEMLQNTDELMYKPVDVTI